MAVGPDGSLSYPPSRDFVMDFDFANFAVESLNSSTFEARLNRYIYSCVAEFILKYDEFLQFGPAGEFLKSKYLDGQTALYKVLVRVPMM